MKIAIVGTGISGLVSAHLLSRDHEISVFEANDRQIAAFGLIAAERRKWCFYFSYCEGGFLECTVTDAQLLLAKPGHPRHHEPVSLAEKS